MIMNMFKKIKNDKVIKRKMRILKTQYTNFRTL